MLLASLAEPGVVFAGGVHQVPNFNASEAKLFMTRPDSHSECVISFWTASAPAYDMKLICTNTCHVCATYCVLGRVNTYPNKTPTTLLLCGLLFRDERRNAVRANPSPAACCTACASDLPWR